MVGLSVFEYAPVVEATGCIAAIDEVLATRKPKTLLDFPYASNPAQMRWFNRYMIPLIIDGEVVALVSMSVDVTELHEAEAALRENHERLQKVLQVETVGVMFWT